MSEKLIGVSRLSTDNKMTLVEEAAKVLEAKKGDLIAFYEEKGRIILRRA